MKPKLYYASSESVEHYTPRYIWERAILCMGAIDCDPAADIGKHIPAAVHFTKHQDGLSKRWTGRHLVKPTLRSGYRELVYSSRAGIPRGSCHRSRSPLESLQQRPEHSGSSPGFPTRSHSPINGSNFSLALYEREARVQTSHQSFFTSGIIPLGSHQLTGTLPISGNCKDSMQSRCSGSWCNHDPPGHDDHHRTANIQHLCEGKEAEAQTERRRLAGQDPKGTRWRIPDLEKTHRHNRCAKPRTVQGEHGTPGKAIRQGEGRGMTRDIDHAYDEAGQWTGPGRERYQIHYAGTGKAKGRKRRQVIPACSADGD